MAAIQAQACYFPSSSWVHAFILTCDNKLAVWFKRHVHHRHHRAYGGVPGVCCLYPTSNKRLYDLAVVWWSAGHFVHQFLYKLLPYRLVQPPVLPCSGCATSVAVTSSENPSTSGDTVTFTATVSDTAGSATPQGSVAFYDGSTLLGNGSALSGSGSSATSTYATSALAVGSHTITAKFTGSTGFQNAQGSVSQTVNSAGVTNSCCGSTPVPLTLHVTLTGSYSGTYALTYNAGPGTWTGTATLCGGSSSSFILVCTSGTWNLTLSSFGSGCTAGPVNAFSASCSPLSIVFHLIGTNTCCFGQNFTATVTT